MASKIVLDCGKAIASHKLKIAFAESATAGRMSSEFALCEESGKILLGGITCYDVCVKENVLGVSQELIKKYTPESAEVTQALAERAARFFNSDITVAVTGLTTPGGSENKEKPVGTIFLHILLPTASIAEKNIFKGSPEEIILQAIDKAVALIYDRLQRTILI